MFATPATQQLVTEIVELVSCDDCGCDDDNDCKEEGRCPGPCQTCQCCPHSNAVASTLIVVPVSRIVRIAVPVQRDDGYAEAHASPPFRPPTA